MKYPLVSVIMPVYHAEKYVAEAIESILDQTLFSIKNNAQKYGNRNQII